MKLTEKITETIDRVIGVFSPVRALNRQMARKAAEQKFSSYTGASNDRPRSNWNTSAGSADADLLPELEDLRERSRDLVRNDPHASSIQQAYVDNIVGNGIKPQSLVSAEELNITEEQAAEVRKACEYVWQRWVSDADASEHDDFYGLQALIMKQIFTNGEVFVLPTMVNDDSRPFGLALEIIESDRVESKNNADNPNQKGSNLRSGIELGKRGEPLAYWIRTSHPGDGIYERNYKRKWKRYPSKNSNGRLNVLHLMNKRRPGQTRGEPLLSSSLATFRDLSSFLEATLIKERVSACFSMIVTSDDPYQSALQRSDSTRNGRRINSLEPGAVEYLAPGENVQFGNPNNTGSTFDPFVERNLRAIGASLGLPIELVTNDFSKTNYSSARAALLESRRMFKRHQEYLISRLCKPVYEMLIEEAWLRGFIPHVDFDKYRYELTKCRWVPPGWAWVDPLKEAQASAAAVELGVSSLAEEAASQGRDWEELIKQKAYEEKRRIEIRNKLGLKEEQEKKDD